MTRRDATEYKKNRSFYRNPYLGGFTRFQRNSALSIFFIVGGTEDLEYLPIQMFRKGMKGCVGELSIGRVFGIDMIQKAKNGRNVDTCQDYK